jgi:restriction endonuclease
MRLRFDPHQLHQRQAIDAVLDALGGTSASRPMVHTEAVGGVSVVRNVLPRPIEDIDTAVRAVQAEAGLPQSGLGWIEGEGEGSTRVPALSLDLETGTGKTYAFIRSALELSARFGLRKFIIVVPSVAIREGVLKTLQVTRDHFSALYPETPYRFFAYDRSRMSRLDRFARSGVTELMVITIDAFNKASNVLRQPADRFGGRVPLEWIRAVAPVLILDEPHHFDSPLRVQSLCDLSPVLALRWGAVHRDLDGLVHRLSPAEAHARGLVKTIEVVPSETGHDDAAMSARIHDTVAHHLQLQARLRVRGIKVLSLFFVDRVASYVDDDGLARTAFDRHFEALRHLDPAQAALSPQRVRAAYFAEQRHRPIDSKTGRSATDERAYELIMRDKERLLSLDEPVSFVFTHSALREGWDNPNVFQICTLARSTSKIKKRQEIGRGVRLCVDQHGDRVVDPELNVLRVFANESYEDYVAGLQSEYGSELDPTLRPPQPRRATEPRPKTRAPEVVVAPEALDHDRLVRRAAAAANGRLEGAAEEHPEVLGDLVATIELLLARRVPPCPLGPATILEVLQRIESVDRLVRAPQAVAHAVADALSEDVVAQSRGDTLSIA